MRSIVPSLCILLFLVPRGAGAQDTPHVAVEAASLVIDQASMSRLGLSGIEVLSPGSTITAADGRGRGTLVIGTRLGGLDVSVWLDLVRRERAVRSESAQRIVVLSGHSARISNQRTLTGPYGQQASAGPMLWVAPVALDDGMIRLHVWTAVGEVHAGPFGAVWQEVPVEGRTEIVVASGTPVVIASTEVAQARDERGVLSRGAARSEGRAWIVVTARVVEDPANAFELPAGIPRDWLGQ